jgi:hypothetical protein
MPMHYAAAVNLDLVGLTCRVVVQGFVICGD